MQRKRSSNISIATWKLLNIVYDFQALQQGGYPDTFIKSEDVVTADGTSRIMAVVKTLPPATEKPSI